MENIVVTGATGFIGHTLCNALALRGYNVLGAVRNAASEIVSEIDHIAVGDIGAETNWSAVLSSAHCVIHCAARSHVMHKTESDALVIYRSINVDGTRNLAEQAAKSGVKRFIYLSSIKVNGEITAKGKPFTYLDKPRPEGPYGTSKLEAEQALWQLASETGMEVVIIRSPLVYGQGVKGNFAVMTELIAKGLPLPLGSIHNQRSLVGMDNLVDLIITCIDHPAAANQMFLAGDGQDLSTTELLRGVAQAMGKPLRLFPISASLLMLGATLLGKKAVAQRLLGSLQVDISKTCDSLGWEPPITVGEGLRRCFEHRKN